jgi:hypothetical protein
VKERREQGSGSDQAAGYSSPSSAVGKQTLIGQLYPGGAPAVQRKPGGSHAAADAEPGVAPPVGGIDKPGFIDQSDGANLRDGPAESGGHKLRDQPLSPATRVFVTGTHPGASDWWYVTAYVGGAMVRGYVQGARVNIHLPEPLAKLHQVVSGDTVEKLAAQEYGSAVRDGHDLRYYENVLLYVNAHAAPRPRAGIAGSFQDPGVLGGGGNNIQLVAGHRIWLVSPGYAKALEHVVPSGSLTGGAVAKAGRFVGHLQDILRSVAESRNQFGEVAGEYAEAIHGHLPEIAGIVAGFIVAEATSAFLAATPTGIGQIAAVVIQLALAAFGAAGMVQAGAEAATHAIEWLAVAWTAKGDETKIASASKAFLHMLVSIAVAALSYAGAKGNYGNALKIARSMPTGGLPALAVAGSGRMAGAGAGTGVLLGPSTGSIGAAGHAMMQADHDGDGRSEIDDAKEAAKPTVEPAAKGEAVAEQTAAEQAATETSVVDKLQRYVLNPEHPVGSSKAKWFKEALGYTRENAGVLASQIRFSPTRAIATELTTHGQKFNQTISIVGVNGKSIDVMFAWIRNNDGIVRLVSAIPSKK